LAYVLGTCTFFGALLLIKDPNPPDNIVDSIFMAISAMSGAGLTTIPMSDMSPFGMGCIFILMLAGGITFLLLPPVLYRLYQYRQFKPMVQEVIQLRKVIRGRSGENVDHTSGSLESDLIGDFELQDEALQYVALVIICYDLCFLVFGSVLLYAAIQSYGPLPALQAGGHNPAWFATFAAVSSFNNVGFSLLDDNYTQLADRPAPLLLMTFMIIAGNTGLPIFLRCIFATISYLRPNNRAIRFVLDNPRRCTTAFFNTKQTAALFVILVGNLMIQYVFFLATSMHKPNIRALGTQDQLAMGGWFTSVSTRAAGMNVFDLRELSKANVLVFALMMYISSAPLVSLMETTRQEVVAKYVNGELLLVYEGGDGGEEEQKSVYKQYLNSHLRWLVIFYLVIATAEERVLVNMPPVNLFDIMFEILSAYGTSGLSMGAPGKPYSLCGEFNNVSKIILCVVKIMGKHRGLPKSTDAALDGQFHKIHGMLEQLQDLAKKQKEGIANGETPADAAALALSLTDTTPVQQTILQAASEGLARVTTAGDENGGAAGEHNDGGMNGFTLRPE
jgi:Trk-type K+ transport system membrane component